MLGACVDCAWCWQVFDLKTRAALPIRIDAGSHPMRTASASTAVSGWPQHVSCVAACASELRSRGAQCRHELIPVAV